jgi:hypothetical protein
MPPGEGDLAVTARRVLGMADGLGERLLRAARSRTSLACQRALLRVIGVSGLAPNGRPLALDVVHQLASADRRLLRNGVGLPFALAAYEYDLEPQQLAGEIAIGHIDLAAEAALLRDRSRSGPARALLGEWLAAADDRFEANRVARAELGGLLGNPSGLCLATELRAFDAREAATVAADLVAAGIDLVRVRVPRDGELRDDLGPGVPEDEWPVGPEAPPPAGSQRGLAALRLALDEAGARNGRYARLATRRVGLAAPELAVVAGFEGIDGVFVDPMDAIAHFGVHPDRALTDHAFACALLRRSGARLVLGPGPSTAEARRPAGASGAGAGGWAGSVPAEISGRALALQALARAFTLRADFAAERLDLGAIPAFAVAGGQWERALAEVHLRALLFPGHRLVLDDQAVEACGPALPGLLASWISGGAEVRMVVLPAGPESVASLQGELRGAFEVAGASQGARAAAPLRGTALQFAASVLAEAEETLRRIDRLGLAGALGREGWLGEEGLERSAAGDLATAWAWSDAAPAAGGEDPVLG